MVEVIKSRKKSWAALAVIWGVDHRVQTKATPLKMEQSREIRNIRKRENGQNLVT